MSGLLAEQKHHDRMIIAGLWRADRIKREMADGNSMKESDWVDQTLINPKVFKQQKDAKNELKEHREYNKKAKCNF